jgi:excisionase family DNA binding protein
MERTVLTVNLLLRPPTIPAPSPEVEPRPHCEMLLRPTSPAKLAYSAKEVHELAGTSRSTLYKEIAEGKLRSVKHGRRTLILDTDFED